MVVRTVGILSPGDMGHTVGAVLRANGLRVLTCLAGRGARTRALAAEAGIEDLPTLEALVTQADQVLSILVPSEALGVAERVAAAIRRTGADLLYADCNAVSPGTAAAIGEHILAAGGRYADAGIIGAPPKKPGTTRFYTSGPGAQELAELNRFGLDVRVLGDRVGQASGLKMCYAALTKGLQALGLELLITARLLGLDEALQAEQEGSLAGVMAFLKGSVPRLPPKAYRWVGEMEEIAATFAEVGLTPKMLEGAADVYRFVATTPIADETPENRDLDRDLAGVIAALADALRVAPAR